MTEKIKNCLEKKEEILWTGKPQITKMLDEDVKVDALRRIAISASVCILLVAGYFAICMKNGVSVKWGLVAVVIAICVIAVSHIFTCWKSLKKVVYVITDQRVIIWHSEFKLYALPLKNVDMIQIVTGKNGMDSLCIGAPACSLAPHKLRAAGVDSVREEIKDNTYLHYPVFYNIADAVEAKTILENALNR